MQAEIEEITIFDAPIDLVWPMLSDTELGNEMAGETAYTAVDELQDNGTVLRCAEGRFGPAVAVWTEGLGEWVVGSYSHQWRDYSKGMIDFMSIDFHAEAHPRGCLIRTRCIIRANRFPGNVIGWMGLWKSGIRKHLRITTDSILARLALENAPQRPMFAGRLVLPSQIDDAARTRLEVARRALRDAGHDEALSDGLCHYLETAPASDVRRIRPIALARQWGVDPDAVISLCLRAHQLGLLSVSWEILCPRCRGSKEPQSNLSELPKELHCSSCDIDFTQDFSANVEMILRPEDWLRSVAEGQFCMMGTNSVPHILVQMDVAAGQALSVTFAPGADAYRLRTAQAGPALELDYDGASGFPNMSVGPQAVQTTPADQPGTVELRNDTDRDLTLVIETRPWRADALLGDKIIARADFRELCPDQLMRPGDDVRIGQVSILFTDLKSSTSLYEKIGDAAAYHLVRDHFDYLRRHIGDNNGAVVKTIGDAVMATFADPGDALVAAIAAQTQIADFNVGRGDAGITLKIGLHSGGCIAVNTDGLLDYFGRTVNLAARLQGESIGGDIVVSSGTFALASSRIAPVTLNITEEQVQLRGINDAVAIHRITP